MNIIQSIKLAYPSSPRSKSNTYLLRSIHWLVTISLTIDGSSAEVIAIKGYCKLFHIVPIDFATHNYTEK